MWCWFYSRCVDNSFCMKKINIQSNALATDTVLLYFIKSLILSTRDYWLSVFQKKNIKEIKKMLAKLKSLKTKKKNENLRIRQVQIKCKSYLISKPWKFTNIRTHIFLGTLYIQLLPGVCVCVRVYLYIFSK